MQKQPKYFYLFMLFTLLCNKLKAQLPVCDGRTFYYLNSGIIYRFDPTLPISSSNPVSYLTTLPNGSTGLTICNNINSTGPSPTFYLYAGGKYQYYTGSTWVNTGHSVGNLAPNIAGGGGYIYSLDGINGIVYRYNGSGNANFLVNVGTGWSFDLSADCNGNFYTLKPTIPGQCMNMYNSSGSLINTWTLSGLPSNLGGGGLAVIGNKVYFDTDTAIYVGTISGSVISFTIIPTPNSYINDIGSCPSGSAAQKLNFASIDTGYYCGIGQGVAVSNLTMANTFFNWSVLNGNAVINGTGNSVTITANGVSSVLIEAIDTSVCSVTSRDTVTIFGLKPNLDAGNTDTSFGCGNDIDSLKGTMSNKINGIAYNIAWTPTSSILNGINTLSPVVNPIMPTVYTLTVSTNAKQGGCTWVDSVEIVTQDVTIDGGFLYELKYGCYEDTLILTDTSKVKAGVIKSYWNYGITSMFDSTINPVVIYNQQGKYLITEVVKNKYCADTTIAEIDFKHSLVAEIDNNNEKICEGDTFTLDARKSQATFSNGLINFFWDFGDGDTANGSVVKHSYPEMNKSGKRVVLVITDSLNCQDTTEYILYATIEKPFFDMGPKDTSICYSNKLTLPIGEIRNGQFYQWSSGHTQPFDVVYTPGTYVLTVSNVCGSLTDSIVVNDENCRVFFPSAFTPNKDGKNDWARLIGNLSFVTTFSIMIYDHWGKCVYRSNDKFAGWDGTYNGKDQDIGTYYYMFMYTTIAGSSFEHKGDILLLR